MRAVYNHQATADTQLSFTEGDTIALIGDKREGWQYGENLATNRFVLSKRGFCMLQVNCIFGGV